MATHIVLEGLEFYAYHGVQQEERDEGNTFIVDIDIVPRISSRFLKDDISNAIDYQKVYKIIKEVMNEPVCLLETVANSICDVLFKEMPTILRVNVKVAKLNPPIEGKCAQAAVIIKRKKIS